MHIVLVELSKQKNEADFERLCAQIYGGAFKGAPGPGATELNYPMEDGVLRLKARAALVGYVLRRWSVECSPDNSLKGPEYRLWLRDPLAIYGVESATIALGYVPPGDAG